MTTTLPVVAPVGTTAVIDVLLQLVIEVAVTPLKLTEPVPWVEPKLLPVIVTEEPTRPEVGLREAMDGVPGTVKAEPALATPLTVTKTLPVVAPVGTTAVIDVALQLVIEVAVTPLNVTLLVPCVEPKLVPVMTTEAPTAPVAGLRLVMVGVGSTVKGDPALDTPLTVTTTLPVVAPVGTTAVIDVLLQAVIEVAATPLKLTVLAPCVEPSWCR